MAEKYWSGVKGLALNLYASGNGSLCLGTTDHHDTHATLLRLRRCSSGTGLARRNDEAPVVISRQCKGARKSVIIGTNSAALDHQLPRRQHGRCGSKTSDSGHEGGQSARLKRADNVAKVLLHR